MAVDLEQKPPRRRDAARIQLILGYVGIGIAIVQGIVLVPLYLHYIGAHMYGLWLASGGIVSWLGMLDVGISSLLGQRIAAAYGRRALSKVGAYYIDALIIQVIYIAVLLVVGATISKAVAQAVGGSAVEIPVLRNSLIVACLGTALTLLNNAQQNTASALQRPTVSMLCIVGGGLVGLLAVVYMLRCGLGVLAIPLGTTIGAALAFTVNIIYVSKMVKGVAQKLHFDRAIMRDLLVESPSLFLAKAGHALIGRIEPAIITLLIAPEAAVAFNITRRAADIMQMMVDRIVGSSTAGFAHLYAEGDLARAGGVYRTISGVCTMVSIIGLVGYLALNRNFVSLWVGQKYYAGVSTEVMIAAATFMLVLGNVYSMLLGAMGDISRPSQVVFAEAAIRLAGMVLLGSQLGVAGLPLATAITSGLACTWFVRRLHRRLGYIAQRRASALWPLIGVGAVVGAIAIGRHLSVRSWSQFGCAVVVTGLCSCAALISIGPVSLRQLVRFAIRSEPRSTA